MVTPFVTIQIKPLSVNEAWKGQRFKTDKYRHYQKAMLYQLPPVALIPEGKIKVVFEFGFSNPASDIDNPQKNCLDILQKKYGFNDSRVYELCARKAIVPKGKEYVSFRFESMEE